MFVSLNPHVCKPITNCAGFLSGQLSIPHKYVSLQCMVPFLNCKLRHMRCCSTTLTETNDAFRQLVQNQCANTVPSKPLESVSISAYVSQQLRNISLNSMISLCQRICQIAFPLTIHLTSLN